jgi:cob(I)alamin adenosyltransferase
LKLKTGYIQVYTGNGKGKTTAAIGQAVRAAGFDLRTYFMQFMKEYPYNEIKSLKLLEDYIEIEQFGTDEFVYKKVPPSEEHKLQIKSGLDSALIKMKSGEFDLIVLDEILVSIYFKLVSEHYVLKFIDEKPEFVELILTGRYCPESIIKKADLVTEMKEIKHYYQKGVLSRGGIDS